MHLLRPLDGGKGLERTTKDVVVDGAMAISHHGSIIAARHGKETHMLGGGQVQRPRREVWSS